MLRLVKESSDKLGMIISSKSNMTNSLAGFTIAYLEPGSLAERYTSLNSEMEITNPLFAYFRDGRFQLGDEIFNVNGVRSDLKCNEFDKPFIIQCEM